MKKHKNFDEMFADDDFVTPEERKEILEEVIKIGKSVPTKEELSEENQQSRNTAELKTPADFFYHILSESNISIQEEYDNEINKRTFSRGTEQGKELRHVKNLQLSF